MRGLPGFLFKKGKANGKHGAEPHTPLLGLIGRCVPRLCTGCRGFFSERERPIVNMGQSPIPHYWEMGSLPAPAEGGFDCQDSAHWPSAPAVHLVEYGVWGETPWLIALVLGGTARENICPLTNWPATSRAELALPTFPAIGCSSACGAGRLHRIVIRV